MDAIVSQSKHAPDAPTDRNLKLNASSHISFLVVVDVRNTWIIIFTS